MSWPTTLLACVVALLFLGSVFGPRERVDWTIWVGPNDIGEDLDAYVAEAEARFENIVPGAEKQIVWAGERGAKTALSVVYLHGFSATHREIAPVPEQLAEALGANLYQVRLTGHGQGPADLGAALANDWINDAVEALNIGKRLGEQTLVVSVSTGGTLAYAMAAYPEYAQNMAGIVFISPNFSIARAGAWLLTKPFARVFVPMLTGSEVSWEPQNAEQAKWWTTRYPVGVIFQLSALVEEVRAIDARDIRVPAYFVYSEADTVVRPDAVRDVIARWGGPLEEWVVAPAEGIDSGNHVVAGDILSPAMTQRTVERLYAWALGL